jgi:rod shape-determining protein MreC
VITAQLLLLAYQVKSNEDVRLIRVWAVTAVTPLAKVIESVRGGTTSFFSDYFFLLDVREENRRLKSELSRIKMENQFLKTELSTADRARALAAFQSRSPSKTLPARVIGTGTGSTSQVVLLDVGSRQGVQNGMAVITPDGIVGKVVRVFPTATQVLLVTDPTFGAGVVSQKGRVHGTVKGQGRPGTVIVDYVQNEQKVDVGEWFYTSGDDRIFPKGVPVGQANVVRQGKSFKEIFVSPSAFQNGVDEVLIVLDGVHAEIPEAVEPQGPPKLLPPPPGSTPNPANPTEAAPTSQTPPASPLTGPQSTLGNPTVTTGTPATEADRLVDKYRKIGQTQGLNYGNGTNAKIPDFNADPNKADPNKTAQPSAPAKVEEALEGRPDAIPTPPPSPKPQTGAAPTLTQSRQQPAATPVKPADQPKPAAVKTGTAQPATAKPEPVKPNPAKPDPTKPRSTPPAP